MVAAAAMTTTGNGARRTASTPADQVKAVSKWPTRTEQLSILSGQILSVGSKLSSQLISAGSKLASQIKKKSEEAGGDAAAG